MFYDRVIDLRRASGMYLGQTLPVHMCYGHFHEMLDEVDKRLGIRTRHGCASAYVIGAKPFPVSEYVGARLARLEAHVSRQNAPKYFWLGAGGENV